jgi:hypothetical protein
MGAFAEWESLMSGEWGNRGNVARAVVTAGWDASSPHHQYGAYGQPRQPHGRPVSFRARRRAAGRRMRERRQGNQRLVSCGARPKNSWRRRSSGGTWGEIGDGSEFCDTDGKLAPVPLFPLRSWCQR